MEWNRKSCYRIVKKTSKEGSIVPRIPFRMLKSLSKSSEKVVFLNAKNLEVLKGYKAYVQMNRQGEIIIAITGLSKKSSKRLFDDLETIKKTEIMSDNK